MDNTSLQNLLKRLCKVMWEANITNPITYVTQISYLLFLKMLEEMDAEQTDNGNTRRQSIFVEVKIADAKVDFGKLRWSVLTSDPDNGRMLETLRTLLPKLALHPALSTAARALFEDSSIVIPDGATLRKAVDTLKGQNLLSEDADVKGDLFEILVNDLGSQKKAAQFRTPRHLIRVIVEMVNPQIGQTVCDSACGTGGFLIAAYEHILLANSSPEFIREVPAPYGQPVKRGMGDRLKPSQWKFLQSGTLHGFEGDKDIIRMAARVRNKRLRIAPPAGPSLRAGAVGVNFIQPSASQFRYRSLTSTTRSARTADSTCTRPLGQRTEISLALSYGPIPNWTSGSLDEAQPTK